ncbi:MAG: hypothetical protein ACYTEZ_19190 [Planctomycetota bacterium]|jgi:hypothetical protein
MWQTKIGTRRPVQRTRVHPRRDAARPDTPFNPVSMTAGLCRTCLHVGACTYPRRAGQTVLQCGEFEGESLKMTTNLAEAVSSLRLAESTDETLPLGLCRNCASYGTCKFAKAESGVWQCDEYR